ncbi:hypothetical protein QL093DRAFT_2369342, partial [Fusarium oxysporum]
MDNPLISASHTHTLTHYCCRLMIINSPFSSLWLRLSLFKNVDQKCAAFPLLHQSESPFSYPEFPSGNAAHFVTLSVLEGL